MTLTVTEVPTGTKREDSTYVTKIEESNDFLELTASLIGHLFDTANDSYRDSVLTWWAQSIEPLVTDTSVVQTHVEFEMPNGPGSTDVWSFNAV